MLLELSNNELDKLTELINKIKNRKPLGVADPQPMIAALKNVLESLELSYGNKYEIPSSDEFCLEGEKLQELYDDKDIPDEERDMIRDLNDLAKSWKGSLNLKENEKNLFNMDGFYPFYTKQPCRILFVGREACWMSRRNYINSVCHCIQADNFNGWTVNQYPFHKRQFYIAYGIMQWRKEGKFPEWDDVPYASEMAKKIFARREEKNVVGGLTSISWAFINLSKLSNDTGDYRTDKNRYRPFVSDESNKKNLQEQIKILKPKIIIGANVSELADILAYKTLDTSVSYCDYYEATDAFPPFLNCFHFAAIKKDKECFYDAVKNVIGKHPDILQQG